MTRAQGQWDGEPGVVHITPRPGGTMVYVGDGTVVRFSGTQGFISQDGGRSWQEPFALKTEGGDQLPHGVVTALRLNLGAIGIVTGGGHDYWFRASTDGGHTFGPAGRITPPSGHAIQHRTQVTQLSSGRIIFPVYDWAGRVGETTWQRTPWTWSGMCYTYVFYSDDGGQTWQQSVDDVIIVLGYWTPWVEGYTAFEEPTAIELKDGRVLIIGRNRMGQLFQSFSSDGGEHWSIAEPTGLASSYAPAEIRRVPSTGDLVICWNQISKQEIIDGLNRHRLSVAVSTDEGKTWGNFKNLYSLDDYNYVRPDSPQIVVPGDQWVKHGPGEVDGGGIVSEENVYALPEDRSRYYREPASARTCYPLMCITDQEVLVTYQMGYPMPSIEALDIFPISWLYQPIVPDGPYTRLIFDGEPVADAEISIEDDTAFGWADVLGTALGVEMKRTRVPVRTFLENYGAIIPENGWHGSEGPAGTIYAEAIQ